MGAILTPQIPPAVFRRRRETLARKIGNGALVLTAASVKTKSRDCAHPYSPDRYLYYFCGFTEPQCALLMDAQNGRIRREILLCRPRDKNAEQWEGERAGPLRARRRLQIAESGDIAEFDSCLEELLNKRAAVYCLPGADAVLDKKLSAAARLRRLQNRAGGGALRAICDVSAHADDMRTIKDGEEIALLRRAAETTAAGHRAAMRAAALAKTEYEIEAALVSAFRAANATHAFSPIVAAGENACTLHYGANSGRVFNRDLVLLDAGAECGFYAGDMSRTFPAGGKFSPAQAAVYDTVLTAQRRALAAVRAGARWSAVEDAAARAICRGLARLGICKGNAKTIFAKKQYRRFYMHRIGHFIGLDVHDTGSMREADGKPRILRTGMTLTVEPGLYIPRAEDIPPPYRGIGVRIEDAVAVRPGGYELLAEAPKTRAEIESWMRG
ncbi:MAG: aminopeptidase P family protein [Gammaproteobacteria bacterium]